MVENGHSLALKSLQDLIQALENKNQSDKLLIVKFLSKISENQNYQWNNQNYRLLARLFYLTGRVLFYQDGKFYTTSKHNKASINEGLEIAIEQGTESNELYKALS